MDRDEILMNEYREAGNMMRTYIQLRYLSLPIFFGFIYFTFNSINSLNDSSKFDEFHIQFIGLVGTILFKILEHRAADHYFYYKRRAVGIGKHLKIALFSGKPAGYGGWSKISVTCALRWFYNSLIFYWLYQLFIDQLANPNKAILVSVTIIFIIGFERRGRKGQMRKAVRRRQMPRMKSDETSRKGSNG